MKITVGKTHILISLILVLNVLFIEAQVEIILHDNIERTYLTHLPKAYSSSNSYSLIIAMHGGFGSAVNLQNQSQLSKKADEEGFIVVYPEGVKGGSLNIRAWNAGLCCGYSSRTNIDDVGFINVLLDKLIQTYSIDSSRIYATGMSNGGMMAYRLACEIPERIAAIAPVASTMTMSNCNPRRPVPIIHFHSFNDTNVPYLGGIGNGTSRHYNPPIDSVMKSFGNKMNCNIEWKTIVDNDKYFHEIMEECACDYSIHKYITHDGGHSWPGGKITIVGDPPSQYINANDLMWDFFQKYDSNCSLISGEENIEEEKEEEIIIFPNPSTGIFTIQSSTNIQSLQFILINQLGEQIHLVCENNQFDCSSLNKGIYYLHLQSKTQRNNYKIIIQ